MGGMVGGDDINGAVLQTCKDGFAVFPAAQGGIHFIFAIIGRKALLAEGEAADIAVFDLEAEFAVDPAEFLSKGKSTPFEGMKFFGRTELTLCGGNIVYRRK